METPKEITFQYVKSKEYRVAKVDGAWGGLTPKLGIFMAVYSERPSIPDRVVYQVSEEGKLQHPKPEFEVQEGQRLIREVEVGLLLDEETARATMKWLQEKLEAIEKIKKQVNVKAEK